MNSRKFKAAVIGALSVALVQGMGQLFVGLGMQEQAAHDLANNISLAIFGLFGLHIAGTAAEDYAAKRDTPSVVVQEQVKKVSDEAREQLSAIGQQIRTSIEERIKEAMKR